jgi:putative alpha-1,2-mannosidase
MSNQCLLSLAVTAAAVLSKGATAAAAAVSPSSTTSNVQYVNPLIGTEPKKDNDYNYGGMIPSTAPPFAMTRWTAMTQENIVSTCPYDYRASNFNGFIATHQPAVWMGESGEVAVAAGSGPVKAAFADRALTFSHEEEVSTPQYYKVVVSSAETPAITAELSATSRVGHMRFTFAGWFECVILLTFCV